MKAVIMAGGEGARLRPLTEITPKPLVRLCGRPVLEYLFDWLEENGIEECVLALGCRSGQIREYCARHPRKLRVSFSEESQPLGTAGCVRKALSGPDRKLPGAALVLSGDALCDFPLGDVLQAHETSGALATLVTANTGDPREYGVILTDGAGRITGFVEKPAYSQAVSEQVNTGIYVLSPAAVQRLPERGDFAADFFPSLLASGFPFRAYAQTGYWRDIGSPGAYLEAQRDLLDGAVRAGTLSMSAPQGGYTLRPPIWIGKNVRIEERAVIGPWTVLDDGSAVGPGAQVSGSVLMPGASVGAGCAVRESILGAGAAVCGAASLSGCAVGDKAVIGKKARICPGVRVAGGERVPPDHSAWETSSRPVCFDDEGLRASGGEWTPELAARMGGAAGSAVMARKAAAPRYGEIHGRNTVGVACAGTRACRVLCDALMAGIRGTGASVMDFGTAFESVFHFGLRSNALSIGVYIADGERMTIRLLEEAGLPAARTVEREIERRMAQGAFTRAKSNAYGGMMDLSGIGVIYATELLRQAPDGLEGMRAVVSSENPAAARMLSAALRRLGCVEDPNGVRLEISGDGMRLSMSQGGVRLNPYRTVAAYGRLLFERGEKLAVENDFPRAMEAYALEKGGGVLRYLLCPADGRDAEARALAARQKARDGLMLAVILLADMRRREMTLAALAEELPALAVREESVALTLPPGRVLSRLKGEQAGEGLLLVEDRGTVLVRARKSGRALRLFAEAASWETARELCADTAQRLKKLMGGD